MMINIPSTKVPFSATAGASPAEGAPVAPGDGDSVVLLGDDRRFHFFTLQVFGDDGFSWSSGWGSLRTKARSMYLARIHASRTSLHKQTFMLPFWKVTLYFLKQSLKRRKLSAEYFITTQQRTNWDR